MFACLAVCTDVEAMLYMCFFYNYLYPVIAYYAKVISIYTYTEETSDIEVHAIYKLFIIHSCKLFLSKGYICVQTGFSKYVTILVVLAKISIWYIVSVG